MPAVEAIEMTGSDADAHAPIPALWQRGADPAALLLLAHGAGAGMDHPHLARLSGLLAERGVAVLRYQFPYVTAGSRRPDPPAVLHATVRRAVAFGARRFPELALFAGGRSMGGRMTTQAAARGLVPAVRGIVLFAFPLHPPKRPGIERAEHLSAVAQPMLFLQGTRDGLCDLALLRPVLAPLGERATLFVSDGADHSFRVPKSSGHRACDIERLLAGEAASWIRGRLER
ncbi:MAG TPA: alpha/beta family hydrolase [Thermoanaerobaculia bacterium]|nr:alpha/beta family hydrolase [Thermoanaerobaculia bacterium]